MIRCASKAVVTALICIAMVGCKESTSASPVVGIASFVADVGSGRAIPGDEVTLTWAASNAVACSIVDGDGVSVVSNTTASTFEWTAHKSTMLVLSCIDADGHVSSKSLYVSVFVVEIASFTAKLGSTPVAGDVEKDATVTLEWSALNATTCSIVDAKENSVVEDTTESTVQWTATASTMLTLTCTDSEDNTATKSLYVGVKGAPGIPSFVASPTNTYPGGTVTFTWASQNTTGCVLKSGETIIADDLAVEGSKANVVIASTKTFTLNCTGTNGTHTTREVTVTTDVLRIVSFEKSVPSCTGSCEVTWHVDNATSCDLWGNGCKWVSNASCSFSVNNQTGTMAASGTAIVSSDKQLTLELSCQKGNNTASAFLSLQGTEQAIINSFTVSPRESNPKGGSDLTFAWRTSNTKPDSCAIYDGNNTSVKSNLASNGLTTLTATDDATYVLKCRNAADTGDVLWETPLAVTVDVAITAFTSSSGSTAITAASSIILTITAIDAKTSDACTLTDDRNSTPVLFTPSESIPTTYTAEYTVPDFNGNSILQLTVNCTGNNINPDTASKSLILFYAAGDLKSTLVATPSVISIKGGSSTVAWGSQGAQGCSLKENVTDAPELKSGTSGSLNVEPITKTTYKLTCNNFGSTSTDVKTVDVDVFYFENTPTASPSTGVKKYLDDVTITATITGAKEGDTCTVNTGWGRVLDTQPGEFAFKGRLSGNTDIVMTCKRGTTAIVSSPVAVSVEDSGIAFVTVPAATTVEGVTATRVDYLQNITIKVTIDGAQNGDQCTSNTWGELTRDGTLFTGQGSLTASTNIAVTCKRGETTIATGTVPVTVMAIASFPPPATATTCSHYITPDGMRPSDSMYPEDTTPSDSLYMRFVDLYGYNCTGSSGNSFSCSGAGTCNGATSANATVASGAAACTGSITAKTCTAPFTCTSSGALSGTCASLTAPTVTGATCNLSTISQNLDNKTICMTTGVHFVNRTDASLTATKDDSLTLTGTGSVTFVGGFPNPASTESRTILDGRYLSRLMTLKGLGSKVTLKDVVFRSGKMSTNADVSRGGCLRIESGASASLENVDFLECFAGDTTGGSATVGHAFGGAIYLTGGSSSLSWRGGLAMGNDAGKGMVLSANLGSSAYIGSVTVRNNGSGYGFISSYSETGPISLEGNNTAVSVVNSLFQNNSGESYGGAISLTHNSFLDVSGCVFRNNSSAYYGGAIGAHDLYGVVPSPSPVVRVNHSLFENNSSYYGDNGGRGGAVSVYLAAGASRGTLLVAESRFVGNVVNVDGGALHVRNADVTLDSNTFESNKSGHNGGAMYLYDSTDGARPGGGLNVQIRNSSFLSNIAAELTGDNGNGGALFLVTENIGSPMRIVIDDAIFENNASNTSGGAISLTGPAPSSVTIRRSLFRTNVARNDGLSDAAGGLGGAIFADSTTSLDISDSEFSGNRSYAEDNGPAEGGAIYGNTMESLKIARSMFAYNRTERYGGAIRLNASINVLEITDSDFFGNGLSTRVNDGKRGLAMMTGSVGAGFIRGTTFRSHVGSSFNGTSPVDGYGGTIHFNAKIGDKAAPFRIEDTRFEDNVFTNGVSAGISSGDMGAGGLLVQRCTFARNSASRAAAMLVAGTNSGTLSIVDSKFIDNVTNASKGVDIETGGALHLNMNTGSVVIEGSLFQGNTGRVGGGILFYNGATGNTYTATVRNSTFLNNHAYRHAAEATDSKAGFGGAIGVLNGQHTVNVVNSTFVGNIADADGGAIVQYGATINVYLSTFVGNTKGASGTGADYKYQLGVTGGVFNKAASVFASTSPGVTAVIADAVCVSPNALTAVDPNGRYFFQTPTTDSDGCTGTATNATIAAASGWMGCSSTSTNPTYLCVGSTSSQSSLIREDADGANDKVFPGRHYKVATRRMYVAVGASGKADGTSWADAFTLPSQAITAINKFARITSSTTILENYEVWVKQGTYNETATLSLPDRSKWYGGFEGTETELYQRPMPITYSVLSTTSNIAFHRAEIAGTTTTTRVAVVFDGFRLQKGDRAEGSTAATALTIYKASNVIVQNIYIDANETKASGLRIENSTDVFLGNVVVDQAVDGGVSAILTQDAKVVADNIYVAARRSSIGASLTYGITIKSASTTASASQVWLRNATVTTEATALGIQLLKDSVITNASAPELYITESVLDLTAIASTQSVQINSNTLFIANSLLREDASNKVATSNLAWNVTSLASGTVASLLDTTASHPRPIRTDLTQSIEVQPLPPCPLTGATETSSQGSRWCVDSTGTERICLSAAASPFAWSCSLAVPTNTGLARNGSTRKDKLWDVGRKDFGYHAPDRVWYVDASASSSTDCGKSWATACPLLSDAIAKATRIGDAIWIADGTYRATSSNRTVLNVPAGVSVFGGFFGRETNPDQRRHGVASATTILDGDIDGGGAWSAEDSTHVVTNAGDIALDGLTIAGGNASNSNGGGVSLSMTGTTSALLNGLDIYHNAASKGGGVYVTSSALPSNPSINFNLRTYNVRMHDNRAGMDGGGMHIDTNVSALIEGGSFRNNGADQNGGALYSVVATELRNVVIDHNAALKGGGIALGDAVGSITLKQVQLSRNDAGLGGGLYGAGTLSAIVVNQSTLAENTAHRGAVVFFEKKASSPTPMMGLNSVVLVANTSEALCTPLENPATAPTSSKTEVICAANVAFPTTDATSCINPADASAVVAVPWTTGEVTYVLPKASTCRGLGGTVDSGIFDLRSLSTSPGGESEYSRDGCPSSPQSSGDIAKRDPGYHAPAIDRTFCAYRPGID